VRVLAHRRIGLGAPKLHSLTETCEAWGFVGSGWACQIRCLPLRLNVFVSSFRFLIMFPVAATSVEFVVVLTAAAAAAVAKALSDTHDS
jgi:hypothetical protein